ncbi:hypothetical protein M405DRAFT_786402 [Rhizopogon salebrosus TDB-379]|nr:hypothetical protein M405DRAFT_786402 [Rhizopogon salebrosus TDB-379]
MSQHPISFSTGNFSLDISGVAGFFGGDEAVQALKTIHLYKARRWTGWYNAPGSFAIAKCLGPIANSRFWNALFPGPNEGPETVFGLDNQSGPKYIASQSGTIINKTPHVTYLATQKSKEEDIRAITVRGRITRPMTLTVVEVKEMPTSSVQPHHAWAAIIPISASWVACALCAYSRDWYCLAMIYLGIMSNGLTCLVVGSASVILEGVNPAAEAPPGDGMLVDDSSNHIVILQGKEKDVNWVTKGRFRLKYLPIVRMKKRHPEAEPPTGASTSADLEKGSNQQAEQSTKETPGHAKKTPEPEQYNKIGFCALLLGIQSLLQVLLIPQGTLFGQVMFLSSFVISWVYNLYLSSLDKEKVQQELLFKTLGVEPTSKFELGTRTTAAVFTTLVLRPLPQDKPQQPSAGPPSIEPQPYCPIKFLKCFLPNETAVWEKWRQHVGKHIETTNWTGDELVSLKEPDTTELSKKDKSLLKDLLEDARSACEAYYNYLKKQASGNLSDNWGVSGRSFQHRLSRHESSDALLGTMSSSRSRPSETQSDVRELASRLQMEGEEIEPRLDVA